MDQIQPQPTIAPAPKKSVFPIFFVVLILVLLTASGIFAYQNMQLQKQIVILQSQPTPLPAETLVKEGDPTANWKTYADPQNQYSVKYPTEITMSSYREGTYSGIHLLFIGPTQTASGRIQTSLSDGVSIKTLLVTNISTPLRDYAEQRRVAESQSAPKDDPQPTVSKLSEVLVGEKFGYFYTVDDRGSIAQVNLVSLNDNVLQIVTRSAGSTGVQQQYANLINQILSTFKFIAPPVTPTSTPIPTTSKPKTTHIVPTSWKRLTTQSGLNLCMPPKWEVEAYDHLIFNRDEGYKPSITYITNLPYSGGSRREAYFAYWVQEYPDVRQLVSVADTDINGNSALTIYPANSSDPKTSPEGLTVVWFSAGKLWKAGLSGWNMTNTSQTSFLKDFYTMISCSF